MTIQEWLHRKYHNSRFIAEYHIESAFFLKDIPVEEKKRMNLPDIQMTVKEERVLNRYVFWGKIRQFCVANMVRLQIIKCGKILQVLEKCNIGFEVWQNMHMEPYLVFYKRHIIKQPAQFSTIYDRADELKQLCISKPSPYAF